MGHLDTQTDPNHNIFNTALELSGIMQVLLTKLDVVLDFKNLINDYCEQYHLSNKVNKVDICQIMVEEFKDNFSDGFIRKHIDKQYKVAFRSRNAELKGENKIEKLNRKIHEYEQELLGMTYETIKYAGK